MQEAKNYYAQSNYLPAFQRFQAYANQGNTEAMYYTAKCFKDGTGTIPDYNRYIFWLKKSAQGGFLEAQYVYGMTNITRGSAGSKSFSEGVKYLQKAADSGYPHAVERFIEFAASGQAEEEQISKAIKYCEIYGSQTMDQYKKQWYANRATSIRNSLSRSSGTKIRRQVLKGVRIMGSVLLVLGFLYCFCDLHQVEWHSNMLLRWLPDMSRLVFVPLKFIWKALASKIPLGLHGILGIRFILFAYIFIYASKGERGNPDRAILRTLHFFSAFAAILICFWHFMVQFFSGHAIFEGLFYYLLVWLICYLLGVTIGTIINKVSKRKCA